MVTGCPVLKVSGLIFRVGYSVKLVCLPSERFYSKRKEFALLWSKFFLFIVDLAPLGSMFFPLRVDPLSEGIWCAGKQTGSHKFVRNGRKST